MQQVMATLTQPTAQSHDWIVIDNAGSCLPQWSASVFSVILGCSCCSHKILLFSVLSLEKKEFFFNIIINLKNGPDALMFVLSRARSSRVAWERTTSPRTSAKRDWRFVVWDGLWSGTSSFLSLGAESVARKRRNKSSRFFKTEFGTIQGVFQDVKRPEMLDQWITDIQGS